MLVQRNIIEKKLQKHKWNDFWFLGGDLIDIRETREKLGGKPRSVGIVRHFKEYIQQMEMVKLRFIGREWTWANNRVREGYVEERLDRFFVASE